MVRNRKRTRSLVPGGGKPRRALLKSVAGLALGFAACPAESHAQDDAASSRPKPGDVLVKVGDLALQPLTPADMPLSASPTMAWAMDPADKTVRSGSRLNRVLLIRMDPQQLSAETRAMAADGVVAYTAICTHSGCEIADWLPDEQVLYCSCHASKFDPRDAARVVDGPAPRNLPALPLGVTGGQLVVAKPFTSRVGFESA